MSTEIKGRNVLLVILWSYGLYVLMHLYQYLGTMIVAWRSGHTFEAIISGKYESTQTEFLISLTALIVGVPLIFLVARFLWGRSIEWMRLQLRTKYLMLGLVLGFLLPFVLIQFLKILGIAKISLGSKGLLSVEVLVIIGYACKAIFSGIAEEVVFRGMAVRDIAVRYGWLIAAIIGGVYFGATHLVTKLQEATLVSMLWIILASTLVTFLFVAMYIRSRSLWLPIGFHIAWNFCLQGVMGITMSGNTAKAGLLNLELTGNTFLTGGSFGIEASGFSLIIYVLVALLFLRFPRRANIKLLSSQ